MPGEKSILGNSQRERELTFRGLFAHAWDFSERDIPAVLDSIGQMGLNTICFGGTYHSGWFLHPQHLQHRAFMTEGSVCYFQPQDSLYQNTKLRPRVSGFAKKQNLLAEIGQRLDHGLRLASWTIGAHNSRLGLEHPEFTQQTVYGDRLPHALCFANADVREYLKALCRDLATNYPLWGLQLESFGWMSFNHGHHHERDLVGLNPFEQSLMSLCFCSACSVQASRANVEIQSARAVIKQTLDGVFREAPERPKNHPGSMEELEGKSPALKKFNQWRKTFSDTFLVEIKSESLRGTKCKLLLQSPFDSALTHSADGFACGAYGETPERVLQICRESSAAMPKDWGGLSQCFIQLGRGIPSSEKQLWQIIEAVRAGGCNGINFYNYSESPPKMLGWLKNALPHFSKT